MAKDTHDSKTSKDTKKKRSGSSTSHSVDVKRTRSDKQDLVVPDIQQHSKSLFSREEKQARDRSPDRDSELHRKACTSLRNIVERVRKLKKSGKSYQDEITELRIQGSLHFITFKKLNRLSHHRNKQIRENTSEAKLKIDGHHLRLQNLLYEAAHLEKEIRRCLEFRSEDEDIELVDIKQFFEDAPEAISKPDLTKLDEHRLTLARLDWELEERKRLAEQLESVVENRQTLGSSIDEKRTALDSLQPELVRVMEVTRPVQSMLGVQFEQERQQHDAALALPSPLYVLFQQLSAYKAATGCGMIVTVEGDLAEAQTVKSKNLKLNDDSGDSDQDDKESEKKKKKRRHSHKSGQASEKINRLATKHPLEIQLVMEHKDGGRMCLKFCYLLLLNLVTVKVSLEWTEPGGSVSAGHLMKEDSFLCGLFDDDRGDESPNPANVYTLQTAGLSSFRPLMAQCGRPYRWAQLLAGLTFLPDLEAKQTDLEVSRAHVSDFVRLLQQRFESRLALSTQLQALERGKLPDTGPSRVVTSLRAWKTSTLADYSVQPCACAALAQGLAGEDDAFFTAGFERGPATVTSYVVLPVNYPQSAPLWAVQVTWRGERTAHSDSQIREMEAELNVHLPDEVGADPRLLTLQAAHAAQCLDVYLETCSAHAPPPLDFSANRAVPRAVRGPQRNMAYKLSVSSNAFVQR